jgi:hypothetical protein
MTKNGKSIIGVLLIAFGLLFLLKTLGVISFPIMASALPYWPIGLILAGIAIIYKQRALGITVIILTLVFICVASIQGLVDISGESGPYRELTQTVPFDESIDSIELELGFGTGELTIKAGNISNLVENSINTYNLEDPRIEFEKEGSTMDVEITKHGNKIFGQKSDEWSIELMPGIKSELNLHYGAAEAQIDLTDLEVDELHISSGATESTIIFATYPTKTEIETGASSLNLLFPEDVGVAIDIDGGAVSKTLTGFTKKGGTYFSEGYDNSEVKISVDINAGATSVTAQMFSQMG